VRSRKKFTEPAGIPYQVFGERSGALALTIAWTRSAALFHRGSFRVR
jgi:hypothetical protein